VSLVIALFGAFYWMTRVRIDRIGKMASLTFFLMCIYWSSIRPAPWYLPPFVLLGAFAAMHALFTIGAHFESRGHPRAWLIVLAVAALLLTERGFMFFNAVRSIRLQQSDIEFGTRMQVGLWLKDRVGPDQRIYLEPLGYIGYFSGAYMTDYPGLVTPDVVWLRKQGNRDFVSCGLALRPEWMVLRPGEAKRMSQMPDFDASYERVAEFDSRQKVEAHGDMPGKGYLLCDAAFWVYRRKY
jgi:hypothetical protein